MSRHAPLRRRGRGEAAARVPPPGGARLPAGGAGKGGGEEPRHPLIALKKRAVVDVSGAGVLQGADGPGAHTFCDRGRKVERDFFSSPT